MTAASSKSCVARDYQSASSSVRAMHMPAIATHLCTCITFIALSGLYVCLANPLSNQIRLLRLYASLQQQLSCPISLNDVQTSTPFEVARLSLGEAIARRLEPFQVLTSGA